MEELEAQLTEMQEQNAKLQEQNEALHAALQAQLKSQENFKPPVLPHANPTSASSSSNLNVYGVSVKLPPFWTDRPSHWFARVESQFNIAGIKSNQTKFDYVFAQLDSRQVAEIDDLIAEPPDYERLKSELIRRLSLSESERVRQLIGDEELNGRKPSQFLRHLRSLAGTTLKDEQILKELWMRRLPQFLQAILTSHPEMSLEKLSVLADSIVQIPGMGTPTSTNVYSSSAPASQDIGTRLDELTRQVAALTNAASRGAYSNGHRSRSRSRSLSSNRTQSPEDIQRLCWYHHKFGAKAKRCITPCSWVDQGNEKGSQ